MGAWEDVDEGFIFDISIDGVHCAIEEPRPFSTKNSSHKLGGSAGVNYELGIKIHRPQLVWVYGPTAPGKDNDLEVFRQSLKHHLPVGTKIIADDGYIGEPDYISVNNEFDPPLIAEFKRRVKSRHETFNQRLKCYKCLTTKFRHGRDKHKHSFHAICAITPYQIDNGSTSLFDPCPADFLRE